MEKENRKCICGKRRANINNTNWSRHLASCKKVKLSLTSQSVSSFFKKSKPTTDTALNTNIESGLSRSSTSYIQELPLRENLDTGSEITIKNDEDHISENNLKILAPNTNIENGLSRSSTSYLQELPLRENLDSGSEITIKNYEDHISENNLKIPGFPETQIFYNDPVNFIKKDLSPEEKCLVLKLGPCQPLPDELLDRQFPVDTNQRHGHFRELWYFRILPDGSKSKRDWLSYSPKLNALFCLPCMLFSGSNKHKSIKAWTIDGYSNWQNASINITKHEISNFHIDASITLKIKKSSLPIVPALEHSRKMQVALNRQIVSELIDIVLFLAQHQLAFRGHREGWLQKNKGNFKDLVQLMATNSSALKHHISLIQLKGRKECSFLSWERQNQLISSVSEQISINIRSEVTSAHVFSISIDSAFDCSRKEQVSFIVRYADEHNGDVYERLLAIKESPSTTGESLFNLFESIMTKEGLNWKKELIGQSYDGASNMTGEYNGLQARIKSVNKQAIYIWCHAHRLNLVVADAVSSCTDAVDLFGNLESLFSFLYCSKKRVALFRENQKIFYPKLQLRSMKRVSTTRWSSHASALETVLRTFDAIVETLEIIRKTEINDRKVIAIVGGYLKYFLTYRFVLTSVTFKTIFDVLNPLTKILQSSDIDLLTATNIVEGSTRDFLNMRKEDKVFEKIKKLTNEFIENSTRNFEELVVPRVKKVPKRLEEICNDEFIKEPIKKFKVETVYKVLDVITNELSKRFKSEQVGILRDISLLSYKRIYEINVDQSILSEDAFEKLCDFYKILDKNHLRTEYIQFINRFEEISSSYLLPTKLHSKKIPTKSDSDNDSTDFDDLHSNSSADDQDECNENSTSKFKNSKSINHIFKLLCLTGMNNVFPNLFMAYKISVTLPVSSCSVERSFSKLKIIKT